MRELFARIAARYGQEIRINGGVPERAFFQPVEERSKEFPDQVTPLGTADGRLWIYLGCSRLEPGDTLSWNGTKFRVRTGAPVSVGTEITHWWAVLAPDREAAT